LTTIVAIRQKHSGVVYMGADTCMTSGTRKMTIQEPKMRVLDIPGKGGGKMVIGAAGFVRGAYEVEHLELPKHHKRLTAVQYLRKEFVPAWRELVEKGGMKATAEGGLEHNFNDLLVVYHGQIFQIDQFVCVTEADHDYEAIGSGEQVALGCLYQIMTTRILPSQSDTAVCEILLTALETAAHFDIGTNGPFHIMNCATGKLQGTAVPDLFPPSDLVLSAEDLKGKAITIPNGQALEIGNGPNLAQI